MQVEVLGASCWPWEGALEKACDAHLEKEDLREVDGGRKRGHLLRPGGAGTGATVPLGVIQRWPGCGADALGPESRPPKLSQAHLTALEFD